MYHDIYRELVFYAAQLREFACTLKHVIQKLITLHCALHEIEDRVIVIFASFYCCFHVILRTGDSHLVELSQSYTNVFEEIVPDACLDLHKPLVILLDSQILQLGPESLLLGQL